jgi:segregation and condensation protein B
MSLKAKLEAVIYAAEEPVTLNQLAALFTADALEWKAAREAAAAEQAAEVAGVSPDAAAPLPLIELQGTRDQGTEETGEPKNEEPGQPGTDRTTDQGTAGPAAPPPQSDGVVSVGEGEGYEAIVLDGATAQEKPAEGAEPALEQPPADIESEARRLARQRDREVKAVLKQLLDELIASFEADGRGVEIREIAGGYRMATKPECHDAVRLFVKSLKPAMKLSLPALETLAVIAYKQPVTAPEVSEIRGVESSGVLGSLLARKLIATAGRKPVIGRPILYKTTREFLLRFGLKDVSELPSMEEFEKMAATELEMEPEAVEADRAADAAEDAGQNAAADLESNSPRGEEPAAAGHAVEGAEEMAAATIGIAESQAAIDQPAETVPPAAPGEPEGDLAAEAEVPPVEPASNAAFTNEVEATTHAQKSQEEG